MYYCIVINFRGTLFLRIFKYFMRTIFVDQGNPVRYRYWYMLYLKEKIVVFNFHGSRPMYEKKHENYAPRKFGSIQYISGKMKAPKVLYLGACIIQDGYYYTSIWKKNFIEWVC